MEGRLARKRGGWREDEKEAERRIAEGREGKTEVKVKIIA